MVTCSTSNASALPNSTTASDFTLTFTSANGTQPQPIKLGTVGDISSDQSVSISCVPSNAGGLTSADQATFVVAAVKLKILVVAGASAVSPSGTAYAPGADVTAQGVARVESQQDGSGNTVKVSSA